MARYEFPASFAQQRMWLLDRLDPGQPTYNVAWAVWLDGPLDTVALDRAWAAAVGRHESLRTGLRAVDGLPVQWVDDDAVVPPVEVVSMTGAPTEEVRAVLAERARAPFDLAQAPLARAVLLRLAQDRHVLSLVVHHVVADGWSFRLLFDELSADYAAIVAGGSPCSPEPPVQYADVALWELDRARDGGYASAEEFWRRELAGAPPQLPLPVDRPYPAQESAAASTVDVVVDAATAARLRAVAAERGSTLFTVVLAAYAALLARLTGATDLLVAVPVAARGRPETEHVVGPFVNTLAIRAVIADDLALAGLVDRLHAATARAQAHQELPFARVVEQLRPERTPGRPPLVQVQCALEEPWPGHDRGGVRWRPELVENGTGKFELELSLVDSAELAGRLRYRSDLFEPATARRIVDGLHGMLTALATRPASRASDVDILSPQTRRLVTRLWAAPHSAGAAGSAAALAAAACVGDRPVIEGPDGTLTAGEVRGLADRVAAALVAAGVGPQDTVGIALPRGSRVLGVLLGAWWAGAAYLPLDPAHPPGRLRAMLADAGVRVVVTDRAGVPESFGSAVQGQATLLDVGQVPDHVPPGTFPRYDLPPDAAAFLLYTSGSTGVPKAVTVTQGSLAQLLRALRESLPLRPGDRLAALATFAFDIAILELLLPLLTGGTSVVASADEVVDGFALRRMLQSSGVTAVQATPTTWRMLVAAGGIPEGVRLRMSGGDAMSRDLADTLLAGPGAVFWNLYGPTETTVYCTGGVAAPSPATVDVGMALAGNRVYLLDRWQNPVPPGVIAEVVMGGDCVSRGYHGAPGRTADRYLPDPFAGRPGARMYRTGDLGRWLPDGRLEILGRVDRQVKIRGFRVETGEVEAALRSHPDVRHAVVTTVEAGAGDVRLVGYVVLGRDGGVAFDDGPLREHLRALLPDYMVPAALVPLTELPLTTNSKVDYSALPAPDWESAAGERIAARTPLEAELAALVADLLGLPGPVGVLDNFFALGGHSLTATQLMARIWTNHGVDLPVRTLFDNPTVAGLAVAVAAGEPEPDFIDTLTEDDIRALLAKGQQP